MKTITCDRCGYCVEAAKTKAYVHLSAFCDDKYSYSGDLCIPCYCRVEKVLNNEHA